MKIFITGGAGFIGSNLVDQLLGDGHTVVSYDNLSTGQVRNFENANKYDAFEFIEGDLLDTERLNSTLTAEIDFVFHLAANADIRFGLENPRRDIDQNVLATFNVLEAMRRVGVKKIAFSSTGSVYGEPEIHPTPENAPFPTQTSLYAASKVSGEAFLQAYAVGYGFNCYIFRFVSVMGERYTHGHVFDFYKKLKDDPTKLHVLGNGKQRKSYLYVQDCVSAILTAIDKSHEPINIFNLGVDDSCIVTDSIGWISEELGLKPKLEFSGGDRGWVGDSPHIHLSVDKIRSLGWEPTLTIEQSVRETVNWIRNNEWVFEARN